MAQFTDAHARATRAAQGPGRSSVASNGAAAAGIAVRPAPDHAGADRILDDIFITPRVLDENAFAGYAESLRALIRDVDTRATRLGSTSTDTERLCATIREAAAALNTRTAKGTKLAEALDEKAGRAEKVLARLDKIARDEASLTRLAEAIIEKRRTAFESSVRTAVEGLLANFEGAEKRAKDAEARAAAAEKAVAQTLARVDALEARLAEADRKSASLKSDAELLADRFDEDRQQIELLVTDASEKLHRTAMAAIDHADRDLAGVRAKASASLDAHRAEADRAAANAIEAIDALRLLAQDLEASIGDDTVKLEQRLGPVRDVLARADELLTAGDGRPGLIDAAIDRAKAAADAVTRSAAQAEDDLANLQTARQTLESELAAARASLDALAAQRARLSEGVDADIESLADDLSPIERAVAALRMSVEDIAARVAPLQQAIQQAHDHAGDLPTPPAAPTIELPSINAFRADVGRITADALGQVEQAAEWLSVLARNVGPKTQADAAPPASATPAAAPAAAPASPAAAGPTSVSTPSAEAPPAGVRFRQNPA